MKMTISEFSREQSGAVTADWVVLSGAVILLVMATYPAVLAAVTKPAETINATIVQAVE